MNYENAKKMVVIPTVLTVTVWNTLRWIVLLVVLAVFLLKRW